MMWRMLEKDQYIRGIWEYFSCGRSKAKKFRDDAEKEKQEGTQGQWQREPPAKEYLEQVKCSEDTDCTPRIMNQAFFALKAGDWEKYKSIIRVQTKAMKWALIEYKKPSRRWRKMRQGRLSTAQKLMLRSTDYLRRIIAPAGGQGGVTMSYLCPHCNSFLLEDYVWWVSAGKKHQLVVCDLWRKVRLEATEQAFGRANRRKR